MNGILIANKPKDFTSFDVIAVLRKILNEKKLGHTGTLDPMATGVLPVLIGRATKLQAKILNDTKEYIATFKLGITTDTLDITGNQLTSIETHYDINQIEQVLNLFKGKILQIPPMFSAIKKNGVKLYTLARKGQQIDLDPREITINKLKIINFNKTNQECTIKVDCSKGTYIRSLCSDIGKKLDCGATLISLQRTRVGDFDINKSLDLNTIRQLSQENKLINYILPCDYILKNYDKIKISEAQAKRFKNGGSLDLNRINKDFNFIKDLNLLRVYDNNEKFIGLGKINLEKNELRISCLIEI